MNFFLPEGGGATHAACMCRFVTIAYLVISAVAVALIFIDPGDDPLSAIFAVTVAMPWTILLSDVLGDNVIVNTAAIGGCILLNALILFGVCNFFRRS
ncbi:hypothetical protein [Oceanomicrobium pacificus]|uniref:Uncharacterized protein n=1 Tax=Oceanomicrobium pacificus TaxID=2692916 RepID=A0A6B0U0B7_9RHOB|nr:hypothetical protein [Oceanomicrobium pacificus]MXU64581.1 hypothetical protein [Oceanomicrobium pacificus]